MEVDPNSEQSDNTESQNGSTSTFVVSTTTEECILVSAGSSSPPAAKAAEPNENDNEKSEEYTTTLTTQEDQDAGGHQKFKDIVLKMLDEMDKRVDKVRSDAMTLETERDDILSSLDMLCNSQMLYDLGGLDMDEINRYIEMLARRCMAVQVDVKTDRSDPQWDSLHKCNNLIDSLIRDLKSDAASTRKKCMAYINACSEQVTNNIPDIDSVFESAVLGCSVDDQKRIKKRLTGLYSYFKSTTSEFAIMEEAEEEMVVSQVIERSLSQNQ